MELPLSDKLLTNFRYPQAAELLGFLLFVLFIGLANAETIDIKDSSSARLLERLDKSNDSKEPKPAPAHTMAEELDWKSQTLTVKVEVAEGLKISGDLKVRLLPLGVKAVRSSVLSKSSWWNFPVRDGKAEIKLGVWPGSAFEKIFKQSRPGWGVYQLVIMPTSQHAGAVGPVVMNFGGAFKAPKLQSNRFKHLTGEVLSTKDVIAEPPVLRVQPYGKFIGHVMTPDQKPVSNLKIILHKPVGEKLPVAYQKRLFLQTTHSNQYGQFYFDNVPPGDLILEVHSDKYYWIETVVSGRVQKEALNRLRGPESGKRRSVELMVSEGATYEYQGRVVDESGQPVPRAPLQFYSARHGELNDWKSDYLTVMQTDEEGSFTVLLPTRWLRKIRLDRGSGFGGILEASKRFFEPGDYVVEARPVKTGLKDSMGLDSPE